MVLEKTAVLLRWGQFEWRCDLLLGESDVIEVVFGFQAGPGSDTHRSSRWPFRSTGQEEDGRRVFEAQAGPLGEQLDDGADGPLLLFVPVVVEPGLVKGRAEF